MTALDRGTPITGRPPHNAVRATFPHKMWRASLPRTPAMSGHPCRVQRSA